MENTHLAHLIDEVAEVNKAVDDIHNRIANSQGAFQELESIGIQVGYCQRDALSLAIHMNTVLRTAQQVLNTWKELEATEPNTIPDGAFRF